MKAPEKNEIAFWGAFLADPAASMARSVERGVRAEWFAEDPWAVVWIACEGMWKRGAMETADAIAILTEAQNVAESDAAKKHSAARLEWSTFEDAINSAALDVSVHIPYLREAHMARLWRNVQRDAGKFIDGGDVVGALTQARSDIDAILAGAAASRKVNIGDVCTECENEAHEAYRMRVDPNGPRDLNWTPGYKMPWPELTGKLGGLEPGLHVIAARPSVGKTSFAINLMRFWLDQGYKVVFDSLDMDKKAVMWRFIAERARVSIKKVRFSPTGHDLDAVTKAKEACAKMPLTFCQIRDVDEFRSFCQIEQSAGRLNILVVDYLGLLHSSKVNNGNEYERVSYVSDALKSLSLDLGVPVVALCQLNRDVAKSDTKRMPGLSDLRGSGAIEQDAYTVTLLHRDERVVNGTWKTNPPVNLMPKPANYYPGMPLYGIDALDSVWAIICKAQNYGTGQLPFVVRKNYFTWSLADYSAQPLLATSGYGATASTIEDNTPFFARVHSDWRNDPIEDILEAQGTLIRGKGYAADDAPPPAATPPAPAFARDPDPDEYDDGEDLDALFDKD